jgi:hypothetical protein
MPGEKWTDEQIQFLEQNFEGMSCQDIAKTIGKTTRATQHKFNQLGLKRKQFEVGDIIGDRTIVEKYVLYKGKQNHTYCKIQCQCGNITDVKMSSLNFQSKKCHYCASTKRQIHNHEYRDREDYKILYNRFKSTLSRCYNTNVKSYSDYGGRGIKVCDEWRNNFTKYYEWAIANGFSKEKSLDRIDVNGDYCPENCRFTDAKIQANNNTRNVYLTAFGETKTATQWTEDIRCVVSSGILIYRIKNGWDSESAIITKGNSKRKAYNRYMFSKFVEENYPKILEEFLSKI